MLLPHRGADNFNHAKARSDIFQHKLARFIGANDSSKTNDTNLRIGRRRACRINDRSL